MKTGKLESEDEDSRNSEFLEQGITFWLEMMHFVQDISVYADGRVAAQLRVSCIRNLLITASLTHLLHCQQRSRIPSPVSSEIFQASIVLAGQRPSMFRATTRQADAGRCASTLDSVSPQ